MVSDAPAYPLSSDPAALVPKFMSHLQDVSYSFNYNAQQLREIGSFEYIKHRDSSSSRIPIVSQPQVELNFKYLMFDGINEKNLGFNIPAYQWNDSSESWSPPESESGILTNSPLYNLPTFVSDPKMVASKGDVNFFVIAENTTVRKQILGRDAPVLNPEFDELDLIGFGNCYINQYTLRAAVGSFVECSATYLCSNISFDIYDHTATTSPAVDGSGLRTTQIVDLPDLSEDYKVMADDDFAMALRPGDLEVKLINNKQNSNGGFNILDLEEELIAVQSVSIDVNIDRKDLNGFGSNYIKDRKIQFPVLCSLSLDVIAQGMTDKTDISKIFDDDVDYDLELTMYVKDSLRAISSKEKVERKRIKIKVSHAKLNSEQHSVAVGGYYNISAAFLFEVTPSGGFSICTYKNEQ